jgi:hypothetical protein
VSSVWLVLTLALLAYPLQAGAEELVASSTAKVFVGKNGEKVTMLEV